jgi:hypothetical protein
VGHDRQKEVARSQKSEARSQKSEEARSQKAPASWAWVARRSGPPSDRLPSASSGGHPERVPLILPLDRRQLPRTAHDHESTEVSSGGVDGEHPMPVERSELEQGVDALERYDVDAERRKHIFERDRQVAKTGHVRSLTAEHDADVEV